MTIKSRPKIIVTAHVDPADLAPVARIADIVMNDSTEPWSRAELLEHAVDASGMIAFMTDCVDEQFLRQCPSLRIVAGALKGYDNFDAEACTNSGVWLTVVPDLLSVPTAELTVGLVLALSRHLMEGDRRVRYGTFRGWRPVLYGRGLAGATVGILGMGGLGRAIAKRLSGFDCRILYHDVRPLPADSELSANMEAAPLDTIVAQSDFMILALPLTDATTGIVDHTFIGNLKPGCLLINPARGSLVDEEAVADALAEGSLGGYAADVFANEDIARSERPDLVSSRLLGELQKTVLTPHLGSAVADVRRAIVAEAGLNIVDCFEGRTPRGAVNSLS